jgi:hypothetical protein
MRVLFRPRQLKLHPPAQFTQPSAPGLELRLTVMYVQIDFFSGPHAVENHDLIVVGGATSGAVTKLGQLYTWGQVKKVGESQVCGHKVTKNCLQFRMHDAASNSE